MNEPGLPPSIAFLRDRCGFLSTCLELRFQFRDALLQTRDCARNFLGTVTRRDVFGAVPIESNNVDDEESLDDGLDIFFGELRNEFRMFACIFDPGMTENFEPIAFGIIHQEKCDAIVCHKIASREHLAIAFVVREGEL